MEELRCCDGGLERRLSSVISDVIGAMLRVGMRVGTAGWVGRVTELSTNPNEESWLLSITASGIGVSDLGAPVGSVDVSGLGLDLDLFLSPVGVLSMGL